METFKREIFEQLGNLFYAIAAEQHVPLITSGELKMAIKKDWLSSTNGDGSQKVSEAAHLIGVTIDSLQNEQVRYSDAFAAFEKFYHQHQEQFAHALKKQIVETADTVMRILPSTTKKNECYESLKRLMYVSTDVGTETR
ncbi:MAG TPA: hypothetical protein VFT90_15975, partial [Chryseosolibacter sp.]|nr:hypothetical protein [Chryseosolibacter sp.]